MTQRREGSDKAVKVPTQPELNAAERAERQLVRFALNDRVSLKCVGPGPANVLQHCMMLLAPV